MNAKAKGAGSAAKKAFEVQWVEPGRIDRVYGSSKATARRELYHGRHQAVLDGDWDLDVRDGGFADITVYRGLRQRFHGAREWKDTAYYKMADAYVTKRVAAGKVQEADKHDAIARRLADLDALYDTISRKGYRTQTQLAEGDEAPVAGTTNEVKGYDEIRVAIDRCGRYLSVDGRHRLSIARIAGIEAVPVNVVARHSEWVTFKEEILARASELGDRVQRRIDHPDLCDIQSTRPDDSLALLLRGLEGYDPGGRKLVDIGARWGYLSQQMEKLGFAVTAIEPREEDARFARRLRDASDGTFEVFEGSVFDAPELERTDVVLALDVLHRFTRSWEEHDRLIELLRRIRPELVLLGAPRAPCEGHFRNYSPWELADFVARHAGLSELEPLGAANDGGPIFKLSRP